ncbi:cupredoxin domain-containing protein [Ramlibacter rhizophilus]|uniref:Blue (type 1) copper domain-containing protein n=1 Tax=Ramlibacter rhizophilus TaxID=1781167 RepID=A0A4Z0C490_9BURK|nr:cupredoxin family protein [Ramlibacter rhizophilus]TFZ05005.1 hypothetical protein EZ242_04460 [Ramlibacter rhizophilus]
MTLQRHFLAAALAALALAAHAHAPGAATGKHSSAAMQPAEQQPWGIAGEARAARRTIDIDMRDSMRFSPAHIEVREGETVRLRVKNAGKAMHELVIGTRAALDEHAALMKKHRGMEHDEPHMAHVAPDRTGELVWNFNRPGDFHFACLIPGHYDAGMTGTIRVVPTQGAKQ